MGEGPGSLRSHPKPSGDIVHTHVNGRSHFVIERAPTASAEPASFVIHSLDLLGDTVWSRNVPYQPVPLSEQWRTDWANSLGERLAVGRTRTAARIASDFLEQVPLPDFHPPVVDFQSGLDGSLWVREARADSVPAYWLVLDSLGMEMGQVRSPAGFRILLVGESSVYGVRTDELDVQTVVRATIVKPMN